MLFYGVITYIVIVVIFNLPFLMEKHHFSSGNSGLMISLFFLAITAPGFCLNKLVGLLKERTKAYSLLSIALGLLLIWIAPLEWLIIPGCLLVGLGYGVIQPMLYEKTTHAALPQKATMALAFVMMMNYLAILLYPFIENRQNFKCGKKQSKDASCVCYIPPPMGNRYNGTAWGRLYIAQRCLPMPQ